VYQPGKTSVVRSPEELQTFLNTYSKDMGKLVILEAKSSHCRPCKKFASTYLQLAERFKDCVFLEVIGDESPTTRRMMVRLTVACMCVCMRVHARVRVYACACACVCVYECVCTRARMRESVRACA